MLELKALIFDCDGVLSETEKDGHRKAFNEAFKKENIDAFWDVDLYGKLVKISGGKERMKYFFNQNKDKYKNIDEDYIKKLHSIKTESFMKMVEEEKLPIRPGIKRIIAQAKQKGIKMFVCSTSNEKSVTLLADSIFNKKEKWYTKIYAGDVVKEKKPAPDIYNLVKEEYNINSKNALVIEDSRNGLLAAKSAGINCIVTVSYYSQDEDFKEADLVISSLGDEKRPVKILNDKFNIFKNKRKKYLVLDDLIKTLKAV